MTILNSKLAEDRQEQVHWLKLRGWVYQLLMDFLSRPPRMSLIAQWRNIVEMRNIMPISQGGKLLTSYLSSIPEEQLRSVCYGEAEEFQRLFMGHQARLSLYEAVHRSRREGAASFACIAEIGTIYAQSGVAFNKLNGERDDHIALELEFMAVLAEGMLNKQDLRQNCLELVDRQIEFLNNHLLVWAPQFCEELEASTISPLYQGIAVLLPEFIEQDMKYLQAWRDTQWLFTNEMSCDNWQTYI